MFRAVSASLIATMAGLGLLAAGASFVLATESDPSGNQHHSLFLSLFSCSLICAAWVWGFVLATFQRFQLAWQCAKATAWALLAGWSVVLAAVYTISLFVVGSPSNATIWLGSVITGFAASFVAAGCWGFLMQGRSLAIRSATRVSLVTALIFSFPLTPVLLLYLQSVASVVGYIPFLIGSLMFGPTLLKQPDAQGPKKT